jgi:hypothetical protein
MYVTNTKQPDRVRLAEANKIIAEEPSKVPPMISQSCQTADANYLIIKGLREFEAALRELDNHIKATLGNSVASAEE